LDRCLYPWQPLLVRHRQPSIFTFSCKENGMSRVQLALNVDNLDASIAFYSRLFGTQPAKVRSGYANFAVAEPPLKLVLIENPGQGGSLNHLGVEVFSREEVAAAEERLATA